MTKVKMRHQHPVDLINDWFRVNVDLEPFLKGLINIMIDHASLRPKEARRASSTTS